MMNNSATIDVKKPIEKIKHLFDDKFSITTFVVILFSELLGSVLAGSSNAFFVRISDRLFSIFYSLISCGSFLKIFTVAFVFLLVFYLIEYFLSNGMFGFVFIYCSAFIFGLFHGLIAGFSYKSYGLQGITLNALLIVPFLILNYLLFFYFSSECFLQSVDFFKIVYGKVTNEFFAQNFKRLTVRLIFAVILSVVISLLFAIFSLLLSKFFILQ